METVLYFMPAGEADIPNITALYNSNPGFLKAHLGLIAVSEAFVRAELVEMKEAGFVSLLIFGKGGELMGLCDYRPGEEVYLSLLLLDGSQKGRGLGREIYHRLEARFRGLGALTVRIDVATDYPESPLGFWEKQSFALRGPITLNWGGKSFRALTMEKRLAL